MNILSIVNKEKKKLLNFHFLNVILGICRIKFRYTLLAKSDTTKRKKPHMQTK